MSIKRHLVGLAPVLALASLLALPVLAQAAPLPKFFVNGVKAGATHVPVLAFGEIKLEQKVLGNLQCQDLAAGSIWNEVSGGTEKGLESTEGFTTYNCVSEAKCKAENSRSEKIEGLFASAEGPPKVVAVEPEKIKPGEEPARPKRLDNTTIPWSGEAIEPEPGLVKVKTHGVKIDIVIPPSTGGGAECPTEGLELPFEGELEPIAENGKKNGLNPSIIKLEGKGGRTGLLTTPDLPPSEEDNLGYTISEPSLTTLGTKEQLVNLQE
jgi:hypothetical protein